MVVVIRDNWLIILKGMNGMRITMTMMYWYKTFCRYMMQTLMVLSPGPGPAHHDLDVQ